MLEYRHAHTPVALHRWGYELPHPEQHSGVASTMSLSNGRIVARMQSVRSGFRSEIGAQNTHWCNSSNLPRSLLRVVSNIVLLRPSRRVNMLPGSYRGEPRSKRPIFMRIPTMGFRAAERLTERDRHHTHKHTGSPKAWTQKATWIASKGIGAAGEWQWRQATRGTFVGRCGEL